MSDKMDEQMKMECIFTGPLFIVGMPRSGTKLLRQLLNEHPAIGIPHIETRFLPTWIDNWQSYGDLSMFANFKKFYSKMMRLSYFMYMKEENNLIPVEVWFDLCKNFTLQCVFEALIRHDAGISTGIWGDKSPMYIRHLPALEELFPDACFIHIIRDARDHCLSANRTWGKNMIRSAQRWHDDIKRAHLAGIGFREKYLEVKYEDLISSPDKVLSNICKFLNITYYPQMKSLSRPSEEIGDAKGLKEIKSNNKNKYHTLMDPEIRKKIEVITADVLRTYGYTVHYKGKIKRINRAQSLYYKLLDGINLLRFSILEVGVLKTIKWNIYRSAMKR